MGTLKSVFIILRVSKCMTCVCITSQSKDQGNRSTSYLWMRLLMFAKLNKYATLKAWRIIWDIKRYNGKRGRTSNQRDDKDTLDQHQRLSHFWDTFPKSTRCSGDAEYLPSEKNQAHLKVPDKKPALAIEGLGFTSTAPRDVLPHLSKPVKYYDRRCIIPGHVGITAPGVR